MADLREQTSLDRLVGAISVEGIIDRVFRFIEMIVIATLVGVAIRVVSVETSQWVSGGLAVAAGLYLGIPIAKWIATFVRPSKGSGLLELAASLVSVLFAIEMTSGLRMLLSQTFQIDEPTARVEYQLWKARSGLQDCRGGGRSGPPPARDIPACERKWKAEIGRLEAEKQARKE